MEQKQSKDKDVEVFFALQRCFPLRPIRNKTELNNALEVIADLGIKDDKMNSAERDYFQVLSLLIATYEKTISAKFAKHGPRESLRYLMDINGLRQCDLTPAISEPHLSDFLHGRRNLSELEIARLSGLFKVHPGLFAKPIKPITHNELSKLTRHTAAKLA